MSSELAFVVDALPAMGGAEKVLLAALEAFPGTPVYTLMYNPAPFRDTLLARSPVISSFIDRLPLAATHYRSYLPLMPLAVEHFDLRRYARIVSFSYAVAHGVRTLPGQVHIGYTHTPMRYAWRGVPLRRAPRLAGWILSAFRRWDAAAVKRVDRLTAISGFVAGLVQQAYHRQAGVIYPPVEVERFRPLSPRGDYYVTLSRLVAHKRLDLAVRAFSALGLPLVVVGEGPEYANLRKMAAPNVTFAGYQDDAALAELLGRARGLVHASEEDFGIAIVEAQAAGCPVIVYGRGAALETVQEGQTGLFFAEQTVDSLVDAVERFERSERSERQAGAFRPADLVANACRYDKERFKQEFTDLVQLAGVARPAPGTGEVSRVQAIVKSG